jgi:penicillin-binding protein 2
MKRGLLLLVSLILVSTVFLVKLFQLQIVDTNSSNFSTVKIIYDYPDRGYIYDRNGTLLVANEQTYDVMVVPREVKPFDTLTFCKMLKIDKTFFDF